MSQFNNLPPTFGEPDLPQAQPTWPVVIGIISIVLASLSLICGGCGIIQNAMAVAQGGSEIQTPSGGTMQLPPPPVASIVLMVVGWFWGILLLVAGIQTLRRVASGRMLHLVYAAVSIVLSLLNVALTWSYTQTITKALQSDPQMAQMQGFISGMVWGSICIGLVLGMGYPIFILIWFGAVKKRPEDMGTRQELVA